MTSDAFDLESLVHLEQSFFDAGYTDGHAHGRTHGLIEGRALGREKGYALWEEVGFYAGFARVWAAVEADAQSRTASHARHLLELVAQFPRVNPSHARDGDAAQVDVAALLSKIRARYKALCATLGVRPRLRPAGEGAVAEAEGNADEQLEESSAGKKVWRLEGRGQGSNEMSF